MLCSVLSTCGTEAHELLGLLTSTRKSGSQFRPKLEHYKMHDSLQPHTPVTPLCVEAGSKFKAYGKESNRKKKSFRPPAMGRAQFVCSSCGEMALFLA